MKKILIILLISVGTYTTLKAGYFKARYIDFKNNTPILVDVVVKYYGERQCAPDNFDLKPKETKQIKLGDVIPCVLKSVRITDRANPANSVEWSGAGITGGSFNFTMKDGKLTISKG